MEERSTGVWAPLRATPVYSAVQSILGSPRARAILVDQYLRPDPGADVLDMGCGPGLLLEELGPVRYTGFDPSKSYIAAAKERFGDRGMFFVGSIGEISADELDTYDLVVAKSVLHHVDDSIARDMFKLASAVLRDGGTLVTSDCCYVAGQSPIARLLISRDRGRHVRTPEAYEALARESFDNVTVDVRHDLLRVPYSHAILACQL